MSKEAARGDNCACGQRIAFMEYHWPHCRANPANLAGQVKKSIESKFTKAELEQISRQGPVSDRRIGKKKQKGAKPKLHRSVSR